MIKLNNKVPDVLLEQCKAGDRRAQEMIYKAFSSRLFAVCLRYSSDRMEAEDLLMIGFTNIFLKISSYTGDGSFEGWMRSVVVNVALSNYRKKQRRISTVSMDDLMILDYSTSQYNKCDTDYLTEALRVLPRHYRIAFNMHAVEGYSHREISEALNITETCSKVHVSRARKMLQRTLRDSIRVGAKEFAA